MTGYPPKCEANYTRHFVSDLHPQDAWPGDTWDYKLPAAGVLLLGRDLVWRPINQKEEG